MLHCPLVSTLLQHFIMPKTDAINLTAVTKKHVYLVTGYFTSFTESSHPTHNSFTVFTISVTRVLILFKVAAVQLHSVF